MTNIQEKITHLTSVLESKVKAYREHLHQFPELSYQEVETVAFVKEVLEKIGITNIKSKAKTGLEVLISNPNNPNPTTCIALRADLDALPIQEENEVPYKSKREGVMHACGHDVHTAILLGCSRNFT
jgi:amidohydrolase